jgi:hypothetical protein
MGSSFSNPDQTALSEKGGPSICARAVKKGDPCPGRPQIFRGILRLIFTPGFAGIKPSLYSTRAYPAIRIVNPPIKKVYHVRVTFG